MFCRCFLLLGLKSCSIDKELWHETYGATYQKKKGGGECRVEQKSESSYL